MKKLDEYKFMPIFPSTPVSDPQISPSGDKIAFCYSKVNMDENKYDSHIWLVDERKKPRQFTYGKTSESNPRWSPKGDRLLFISTRPGEKDSADTKPVPQVFMIPVEGGEAMKLTYLEEGVMNPMWSPNGRKILFTSKVYKGEERDDSDVRLIRRMVYRFDGKGWYDGKYNHLFTIPSRGGRVKQLTDGEYDVLGATWSPDSKQVTFIANIEEDADISRYRNIYAVPATGGDPELLWKGEGGITALSWSPDGKHIAFIGRVIEDPSLVWHRNTELFLYNLDEKNVTCLTGEFDRTIRYGGNLVWTPDSSHIYIKAPDHGTVHIYKADLQGTIEKITEGKMTVGGFSLDKKGKKLAYASSNSVTPSELYLQDGKNVTKMTNMISQLLKKLKISAPEEFWFTASDGVQVQGWIVKPHKQEVGEKYPTALEVHGGPRGAYNFNLGAAEHEFQVLAEHGYAVVYTNPRGSTGFGEEFSRLISGQWGDRDYKDCMEAVDHVIENYDFVDPERLGVLGGSYGGWMTNWVVGHTDRFKAAVTMRSITNWYSMHGTSDIAYNEHDIGWGKEPWNDPQLILEKSPITYIENITTPLLIIHSENDFRCPIEQGEQLYMGLKKLGRTTEFVRFPDEFHGLSRSGQPKHRIERLQHILRWFDRYLK